MSRGGEGEATWEVWERLGGVVPNGQQGLSASDGRSKLYMIHCNIRKEGAGKRERGGRGVAVIVNRVFFSQVTAEPEAVVDQVAGAFSGSSLVTTAAAMTRRGGKKKE